MGFISKIIEGLKKTRQSIGFKLKQLFKQGIFGEDFYDDVEAILLSADIGAETTFEIIDNLRDRMTQDRVADPDTAEKYLKEIMVEILGEEKLSFNSPCVIMVVGVNGVGKTTTIGKLANIYTKQGKSVIIAAADTFRAAAADQLEVWAKRANVRLVRHGEGSDPAAVVFDALASAKSKKTDVVLVDTAGRLHNKVNLMEELKKINRVIDREYPEADRKNLIVLDATTGQNALTQVKVFDEAVNLDGIILTKLDGTAKGGVALALSEQVPVFYVGVGESIDDLIEFDASSFVEGIL
ncbi:MAG TPA: signal recognition particle-docking protein FtsY [Eubacteriales bacterium]|nr:signal recognition particle-docking protein FtsY [Eubacteriales bacterium]